MIAKLLLYGCALSCNDQGNGYLQNFSISVKHITVDKICTVVTQLEYMLRGLLLNSMIRSFCRFVDTPAFWYFCFRSLFIKYVWSGIGFEKILVLTNNDHLSVNRDTCLVYSVWNGTILFKLKLVSSYTLCSWTLWFARETCIEKRLICYKHNTVYTSK